MQSWLSHKNVSACDWLHNTWIKHALHMTVQACAGIASLSPVLKWCYSEWLRVHTAADIALPVYTLDRVVELVMGAGLL